MVRMILILLCMASIASAQSPRDSLRLLSEARWHMDDFEDSPDLQTELANAVMRWFVEDAEWPSTLEGIDVTLALRRCARCGADPALRLAVLTLAEQMRQTATDSMQIVYAYRIAREFQYEDGDPFAASVADERRLLSLELDSTIKAANALRLIRPSMRARFPAEALKFDRDAADRILAEFIAISGPAWRERVRSLLKDQPAYLPEARGTDANMLIMLRQARAIYMGLVPKRMQAAP